jgi:WD40 repeat protein
VPLHMMVDPQQPLRGRTLGDFVLREQIGEGSFGQVFRAEQPILEREAVVKVAIAGARDEAAVKRFLAEARLASRLDHPFAAHVYAFGAEPDGLLWIAMELVRGTSLAALVDLGPVPPERAVPFVRRLCEVVHTAHELGIVHRDLKPGNVMIIRRAGSMFPKLLDLGIARDLRRDGARSSGAASGTPLYMAPEQWVAPDTAGPAADVYALAALTFELLTGQPPYVGRSILEIATKHARSAPPPLPDTFPPGLSAAIQKGLAKRVADRFPTPMAFADALIDASGVATDGINLPQLDEVTRDEAIGHAPRPIAEAVAMLDAATSPARARAGVVAVTDALARLAALAALGARQRIGTGRHADAPGVVELLAGMRTRALTAAEWWRLARELCRPFAAIRDAHPIPELVGVFFDGPSELKTALDTLLAADDPGPNATPDALLAYLVGAVPVAAAAVRSVGFFDAYRMVVPATDPPDGAAAERTTDVEVWSGLRRPEPPRLALPSPVGGPALVDAAGVLAVELAPYARTAPPSAGAARELFLVEGPSRRGARLRALPHAFELQAEVWSDDATATAAVAEDVQPYRGLETFSEADASLYFGREREVDELVNRLRTTPWLAVVGPSGSGKSSFVRAGVLPALASRAQAIVVRPGPTPLATLAARLTTAGVPITDAELRADRGRLGEGLRAWTERNDRPVVLVVDQFEELFTLSFDAAEQDAYAEALHRAARGDERDVRVIVTVRDDFLIRTAGLAALRAELTARLVLVTTPARPDLLRILVEPARLAGFAFEDDALPGEMVDEVATRPGALALLSFTASKLWGLRDRAFRRLTRSAYRTLGGVGGALAQHAEAVLADLAEADQPIVREIFRHLVTADGTRAVMSRAELLQASSAGAEATAVRAAVVLEALITARLLTAMDTDEGERIEVVHETLLVAWPRLVAWRQQDAENARMRDQLRVAARQWHDRGRPRGLLWRGEALTEYRLWRARYRGGLTDVESAFGAASTADAARSRRLRRAALVTVIAALTVALIVFARLRSTALASEKVAQSSRARAEASEVATARSLTESYVDQGRRALIAGNTGEALVYLAAALHRGEDTPAIRFMIARALEPLQAEVATLDHGGVVTGVRFTPDGTRVVTAGDGRVALWSLDGRRLSTVDAEPDGTALELAIAPDGRIVTGAEGGSVKVWDADLRPVARLAASPADIFAIAVGPGGRVLASGNDGGVDVWDRVTDGAPPSSRLPGPGRANAFASFSPAGDRIAVQYRTAAATGSGAIWTPGSAPRTLVSEQGGIAPVWTPDGTRVATPGYDGLTRVWDAATARLVHTLPGGDARVGAAVFAPDRPILATGSDDGAIKLWDAGTGAQAAALRGHTGAVSGLAFFAGGDRLASIASDGALRLWDARRFRLVSSHRHGGFASAVDVDRKGELVVTGSWLGTARLWRTVSPSDLAVIGGGDDRDPRVSVDARYLVRAGRADSEVWSLAARTRTVVAVAGDVWSMEAAGGTYAVGAGTAVGVVDLAAGSLRARWTASGTVVGLAIEPGGARVAVSVDGGDLDIVDVATQKTIAHTHLDASGPTEWCDGFIAVAGSGSLVAVRPGDLGLIEQAPSPFAWMARSADGRYVASAASPTELEVWSAAGKVKTFPLGMGLMTLEWTDALLIVGLIDGSMRFFRRDTWAPDGELRANEQGVRAVSVSGGLMATLGGLDLVRIWDLASRKQIHEVKVGRAALALWFADGRLTAISPDGAVELVPATLDASPIDRVIETATCEEAGSATVRAVGLPECSR